MNFCPRMGKGQAFTEAWHTLKLQEVSILHFSTKSKPYLHFPSLRLEALPADEPVEETPAYSRRTYERLVQTRANQALRKWLRDFARAVLVVFLKACFHGTRMSLRALWDHRSSTLAVAISLILRRAWLARRLTRA